MIAQLAKPAAGTAARCGRVAVLMGGESAARAVGLEMLDLVVSILATTLAAEGDHVQVA